MKRTLSILLALLLLLAAPALADTLTVDLDTATEAELLAAQAAISARLFELRAASAPAPGSALEFDGDGVSILEGFTLPEGLFRLDVTCDSDMKVSTYMGDNLTTTDYYGSTAEYGMGPLTVDSLMVETSGAWALKFSPISEGGEPLPEGEGPYVGDLFTISAPMVVTVTAAGTDAIKDYSNSAYIFLCKVDAGGYISREEMLWEYVDAGNSASADVIMKPDAEAVAFFWFMDCDTGIQWSVAPKS